MSLKDEVVAQVKRDEVFGDGAQFTRNAGWSDPKAKEKGLHPQQMSMDSVGRKETYGPPETWLKKPWAQTVDKRPKAQGVQKPLPFKASPATTPTDPHLHAIRQANPNLNSYQFRANVTPHKEGSVAVFHPQQGVVSQLSWMPRPTSGGKSEIEMIEVSKDHRRQGLAEAMYDLAQARGADLVHSSDRSEQGEAFARRVGGPALKRSRGTDVERY